jgi:predicted ABC-type ATPase
MTPSQPECLILAGPNGGGKSTVYKRLIAKEKLPSDTIYVNTDDNLKTLERLDPTATDIAAGRLSISTLNEAISSKTDFVFETTLSSHHSIRTIEMARSAGYVVGLIYVLLQTVELHNARIRTRS